MTNQTLPEKLIKYYKCDEYSCDALLNNYLWASYPLQFNDPFDCSEKFWDLNSFSMEQIKMNIFDDGSLREFSHKKSNFGRRRLFIEKYAPGVICLNECNRDYEDLFWGYYTNQDGFCIIFKTSDLLNTWDSLYPESYFWQKVEYIDFNNFEKGNLSNVLTDFPKWTKYKKKLWVNENEWRFIFNYEDCNRYRSIYGEGNKKHRQKKYSIEAINNITLGYKFFLDQIHGQREEILTENTKAYAFLPTDNQYNLHILTYAYDKGIDLYHIALTENFELVKCKIEILEIKSNKVTVYYTGIVLE